MKTIRPLSMLFFLTANILNLNATNYFVSNSGNDNYTGLSLGASFATLQHTTEIVTAGDTVFVSDGTYAGFDLREVNGTAYRPIVYKALGTNVLINQSGPVRDDGINIENADYIVIDGFICNNMGGGGNGIRVVTSDFCVVRNCRCNNNAERGIFTGFTDDIIIEHNICSNSVDEHGIYVSNSSDRPIVRYNECYGNNGCGIHMNGDASMGEDGIIHDALIYGNIIHDNNRASSINLDGVLNPVIYNNLIYNNHDCQGVVLFQIDGGVVSHGAKIFNNTIIVPSDGRWGILLQDGANVNTEIYNNIIINLHSWRGCIGVSSTSQLACDYNIINDKMSDEGDGSTITLAQWQGLGFDEHSLLANDLISIFVNPVDNNYHLVSGSQAIDKGTSIVNSIVTCDLESYTRPGGTQYDIGAYEYGSVLNNLVDYRMSHLKISPNPASNYLTISYEGEKAVIEKIELLEVNGRPIKTYPPNQVVDVTFISSGIYLVKIQLSDSHILLKKLVIQ